ncbi:DUF159 family protein [Leucobacter sp. Psy1]|nr:DUF159 family protein [Leucobacter sp. Psy1]
MPHTAFLAYADRMCGRVIVDYEENMDVAADSALAEWVLGVPDGARSSWNVKPTEAIPIALTSAKDGRRRFELARWSLVPPWATSLASKFPTFNARSEGVAEKRTFAGPLRHQRCVVPVSGFYEWSGPKGARVPHAIFGSEEVLPMAGLYSWWRDPALEGRDAWHLTATILTRQSAGVMAGIHERMPVFIADELVREWLDPETSGDQSLVDAVSAEAVPIAEHLREWTVRPLRGDGPELLEPAD